MTIDQFSDQFDVLISAHLTPNRKGVDEITSFDEYEKSVFLTKAQDTLVLSLYNGENPYGKSFEETEELRRSLSYLIKEANIQPLDINSNDSANVIGISNKSYFYKLPEDLWFITYESVALEKPLCDNLKTLDVYPTPQDEYHKIKRNPFRGTNTTRALRLDLQNNTIELVSDYALSTYYIRYLKKIHPIILLDLPQGLAIDGISTKSESCELPEFYHQRLLDTAVQMALKSKGIAAQTAIRYNVNNQNNYYNNQSS